MPSTCSEDRAAPWVLLWLLVASACTFSRPPQYARPPRPLPAATLARYELPEEPRLLRLEQRDDSPLTTGELACGDETIRFRLLSAGPAGAPLVLLVPILAGGDDLMRTLAQRFVRHGFDAAWCDRAGSPLRAPQRGADLERLFARTLLHQRAALRYLAIGPDQRPRRLVACGVSMGGMITASLCAIEPSLQAAAVCMAGADLPAILADSAEVRIDSWRQWRRTTDGIAGEPLRAELAASLHSDPLHLAPSVDANRIFFVATAFDDVVRPQHQQLLWEALGRPARLSLPLGHYSAALALDAIVDAIARFFSERLGP